MGNHVKTETEGYQITVLGRHVEVTDAMKQYALEKVAKIDRFSSSHVLEVIVTMDIVKLDHHVDIVLKVDHTKIKVSASTDNMYASIDKATDRLTRKLRRYRTRIQDHHAKGLAVVDMNVNVLAPSEEYLSDINDAIEEETERQAENALKPHEIVSTETRPLKLLTSNEAVMKMELSHDAFMLYRDVQANKLKLIYRRNDGNFGVIEPE